MKALIPENMAINDFLVLTIIGLFPILSWAFYFIAKSLVTIYIFVKKWISAFYDSFFYKNLGNGLTGGSFE